MSKEPLCVALLWHMHQPDYGNRQTGEIYLPWTRFHAAKDYYDMGALIEDVPGLRLTLNVVPSLMDQLTTYGSGNARDTYAALTLKNAGDLDAHDKEFLLRSFFQLPHRQMVEPYPRYRELRERRGSADDRGRYPDGLRRFTARDYRDLQVWFNLAWCGSELRRQPEIAALLRKGKGYSEDDKRQLIEIQQSFAGRILPLYRRLMEAGAVEISVSPYYHPILPLLCDIRSAREALSHIRLPEHSFSYPEDARRQVGEARRRYEEVFGKPPRGLWPSEGSISDAVISIADESGFVWLASDEEVLANSLKKAGEAAGQLPAARKFCTYRRQGSGPALFFRDHGLSDLIGFAYAHWSGREAAEDLVRRLRQIHSTLPDDGRRYIVPIVLDGENAWEHYQDDPSEFLRTLYRLLTASPALRTVTFSEFLEMEPSRESLRTVAAGSWIYGNLATWVGHPEKNRAWNHLAAARKVLGAAASKTIGPERVEEAWREMMIAEGSDWFWWYGDDHQTQNAAEFDALFRNHVKNVYRCLGQTSPPDLDLPIKKAAPEVRARYPVHTMTPRIDGRVTNYFEWLCAGFATPEGGESMHRVTRCLEKVFFGYDTRSFYVRIDLTGGQRSPLPQRCSVQLEFVSPKRGLVILDRDEKGVWRCRDASESADALPAAFGAGRILELAIPLDALGILQPQEARFFVTLLNRERELERFPAIGFLSVPVDPWQLDEQEWFV
ncbi:MAG: glycoside hydrolase [Acidobacteria bacterium]|nr:glycoside hydrolase [Acidobacteriota bacterium]